MWFSVLEPTEEGLKFTHETLKYDHETAAKKMSEFLASPFSKDRAQHAILGNGNG